MAPTVDNQNKSSVQDDARQRGIEDHDRLSDARASIQDSTELSEDALLALARGWIDLSRVFIPVPVIRPAQVLVVAIEVAERMLAVQRRVIEELLHASRTYEDAAFSLTRGEGNERRTTRRSSSSGGGRIAA